MKRTLTDQFVALRRCDTPLVAIRSADPVAALRTIRTRVNGESPQILWDGVRGFSGLNEKGEAALADVVPSMSDLPGADPMAATRSPVEMLSLCEKLPEASLVWAVNLHRFWGDPLVAQGIANLRETFRGTRRTLAALGCDASLPPELANDIVVLDDRLPDDAELAGIISRVHEAGNVKPPADTSRHVDGVRALTAYMAEQCAAMALTPKGIDLDALWALKVNAIESTPGLTFDRSTFTLDDIGGLDTLKRLGSQVLASAKRPGCVLLIDEIEKSFAGLGQGGGPGDSSGVTQDILGVLLRWMENSNATGIILVGPPGSGKTLFSKGLGRSAQIPSINLDLGALKGQYVGQSEQRARAMIQRIEALAGSRSVLVVATCNRLEALPPELRRRFKLGVVYCDLPTRDEKDMIWALQRKRFAIPTTQVQPDDPAWTGAEIRNCCELADVLSVSLVDAASYIVPVAKADPDSVERLRNLANGRFLSASYPGVYKRDGASKPLGNSTRKIGGAA